MNMNENSVGNTYTSLLSNTISMWIQVQSLGLAIGGNHQINGEKNLVMKLMDDVPSIKP